MSNEPITTDVVRIDSETNAVLQVWRRATKDGLKDKIRKFDKSSPDLINFDTLHYEVPTLTVYAGMLFNGNSFDMPPKPPPTADDVRQEAQRRMMYVLQARDEIHLQTLISNGSREAIKLLRIGSENWTADEATRAAQLEGLDAIIDSIRASSNAMESNPPQDYTDNKHWPNGTSG